ncbi:MAG: hypothetical protein ACRD2J_02920 [Thermoanaerobaculia bacterium]
MRYLKAFLAGAIAVLIFHQGMLAILQAVGLTQRGPFSMEPTAPFGVPQVVSAAFWGGLWGIVLLLVLRGVRDAGAWWATAILVGTIATTLVAWFVVAPIKQQPIAGGWRPEAMAAALLVNGAWAVGTAILFRVFRVSGPALRSE